MVLLFFFCRNLIMYTFRVRLFVCFCFFPMSRHRDFNEIVNIYIFLQTSYVDCRILFVFSSSSPKLIGRTRNEFDELKHFTHFSKNFIISKLNSLIESLKIGIYVFILMSYNIFSCNYFSDTVAVFWSNQNRKIIFVLQLDKTKGTSLKSTNPMAN